MRIPKKVAVGMAIAGATGLFASAGGSLYFRYQSESIPRTSLAHLRLKAIEQESMELKDLVFDCVPINYNAPVNDCVDKKVQYISLQQEKDVVMQSKDHRKAEEKQTVYEIYRSVVLGGGLLASFFLLGAGLKVYTRRDDEEFEEDLKLFDNIFHDNARGKQ